jgi:hypothetical protein
MRVPPWAEIESLLPRQTGEALTYKPVEGEGRYGTERGNGNTEGRGTREVTGVTAFISILQARKQILR